MAGWVLTQTRGSLGAFSLPFGTKHLGALSSERPDVTPADDNIQQLKQPTLAYTNIEVLVRSNARSVVNTRPLGLVLSLCAVVGAPRCSRWRTERQDDEAMCTFLRAWNLSTLYR